MIINIVHKPCLCGAATEPHYHISPTDIIPWEKFKCAMKEFKGKTLKHSSVKIT